MFSPLHASVTTSVDRDMDYIFRKDDELNRLPQCQMFYGGDRKFPSAERNYLEDEDLRHHKIRICNFDDFLPDNDATIKTSNYRYGKLPQHQLSIDIVVFKDIKDLGSMSFAHEIQYKIEKVVVRQTQLINDYTGIRFIEACRITRKETKNIHIVDTQTSLEYSSFYTNVQRILSEIEYNYGAAKNGYMKRFSLNAMCLGYHISKIFAPGSRIQLPMYTKNVENFLMEGITNETYIGYDKEKQIDEPHFIITIESISISPDMRLTDTLKLKTVRVHDHAKIGCSQSYTEVINGNTGAEDYSSTFHAVHISKILDTVMNIVFHYVKLIPSDKRTFILRMDGHHNRIGEQQMLFYWSNDRNNYSPQDKDIIISQMNDQMKTYLHAKKMETKMEPPVFAEI